MYIVVRWQRKKETTKMDIGETTSLATSVTRFGEISPLRQQKLSLWQFLEGLFSLLAKF